MVLSDLLDKLAKGPLSNLYICEGGTLKTSAYPEVVSAINEGLVCLYSQFKPKMDDVIIEPVENRAEYELTSAHSILNAPTTIDDDVKSYNYYIQDTTLHPFTDNILIITDIYDNGGNRVPLNDPNSPVSLMTIGTNVILIPYVAKNIVYDIHYVAKHPVLVSTTVSAEIDLNPVLLEALENYVAYLMHNKINTQEAVGNANKYLQAYQMIVQRVIEFGMDSHDNKIGNLKFYKNGWV